MTEAAIKISDEIATLIDNGVDQFDPVRFRLISALSRRSEKKNPNVAKKLQAKAKTLLDQYQSDFEKARVSATEVGESITLNNPDRASQVESLLNSNRFHHLDKLAKKLKQTYQRRDQLSLLRLFDEDPTIAEPSPEQLSFDQFLEAQENKVLQTHNQSATVNAPQPHFGELKSHKLFKDSWVRIHSDKLLDQAIKGAPKDAGPLNSHGLAIRSILAIKDLSPEYLYRFVSYADTLLWMENMSTTLATPEGKGGKNGKGKAAKPRKKSAKKKDAAQ